jgi:hypothetical protein
MSPAATKPAPDIVHRILGMVGPADPKFLTEKERFHQYLLAVGGPVPLIGEAAGAGIGQWSNSPEEWGQGWGAFGKRYGSNLAYNGVRQTLAYGTSVLLHEDNRYFVSHKQGIWRRTAHAVVYTFAARHPNGRFTFSGSAVTGVIGASAISSIWGPASWKGFGNIAGNAGISFAATAAANVAREFLPDILKQGR